MAAHVFYERQLKDHVVELFPKLAQNVQINCSQYLLGQKQQQFSKTSHITGNPEYTNITYYIALSTLSTINSWLIVNISATSRIVVFLWWQLGTGADKP